MNSSICVSLGRLAAHLRRAPRAITPPLVAGVLLVACGCSSSSTTRPQVQPIGGFDFGTLQPQAAPTSLNAGTGTYLIVTITSDPAQLGANWSVNCQSALPPGTPLPPGQTEDTSCGTFVPQHTMSGPVPSYATSGQGYVTFYTAPAASPKGGTVTLYAASTADPSRFSSLTLTIN